MSQEKLRIFAPIGAAAGLAAAFNAPISAILFVIEEVIGQWSAAVLGSIVLSAVSSVVVARCVLGRPADVPHPRQSTFATPASCSPTRPSGLVGGFASLIFARALGYLRPQAPQPARSGRSSSSPPSPDFSSEASATSVSAGHGRRL